MLREARHWLTARVTDAALWAAPRLSARAADRFMSRLAAWGPRLPVVGRQVAGNMRAVGLYSPETHRAYFAQLGAHFAGALHAWRYADRSSGGQMCPALAELVAERVELDESVNRLRDAAAGGRGAILVGPHIANYLLNLARLNQEVPLTIYLRYSKDARRRVAKERWYRASGVRWISEPADAGGALGRLARMAAALRAGETLFITPDLPQKRDDGTPVRFCEREIYLPAGPAVLALRTRAPVFMLTAETCGARQRLLVRGPYDGLAAGRGRAARHAAIAAQMQWFATEFERFVRAQPALWYLWGDKRWTRALQGDTRYMRPWGQAPALAGAT